MTDISLDCMGLRLAASTYGKRDSSPVLFLHGHSNSRDTWEELAWKLNHDFQVWTLDFRGHGHSDRASDYMLAGYVADAKFALEAIGRPTSLVGHSLGACAAGVLAQEHELVMRAFLEDPAWYLGERGEIEKTVFPALFSANSAKHRELTAQDAPFSEWLNYVANAPSAMGGQNRGHMTERHLWSMASALQRVDQRCWDSSKEGKMLSAINTARPFRCPTTVVRSDSRYGAALLDEHEGRLLAANPGAKVIHYVGCGHNPHRSNGFEERFEADLLSFLHA